MTKLIDYETKSDFEINVLFLEWIHNTRGFYLGDYKILKDPHTGDDRSVGLAKDDNYFWYDFCNNPEDTFKYLRDLKITLIPLQEDDRWMGLTAFEGNKVTRYAGYHTKPLRAGIQAILAKADA